MTFLSMVHRDFDTTQPFPKIFIVFNNYAPSEIKRQKGSFSDTDSNASSFVGVTLNDHIKSVKLFLALMFERQIDKDNLTVGGYYMSEDSYTNQKQKQSAKNLVEELLPDHHFFYQEKRDLQGHETDFDQIQEMMFQIEQTNSYQFTNLFHPKNNDLLMGFNLALIQQFTNAKQSMIDLIKIYEQQL